MQVTQAFLRGILGQEIDETSLESERLLPAFSFHLGCHQRGRSSANRAGLRLKRDLLDPTLWRLPDKDRNLIAASGVEAGAISRRRWKRSPISRPFAVIQDDNLIELVEVHLTFNFQRFLGPSIAEILGRIAQHGGQTIDFGFRVVKVKTGAGARHEA